MDLKEESLIAGDPARHWYYRSKLAALRRMAGRSCGPLLDVGAGSGFFARSLLQSGTAPSAVCVDPGYQDDRDETVSGRPLCFRRSADAAEAGLVLMMDVLEHVEDDIALVRHYAGTARAGTRFVISVPAFMWMWSGHDVFLGHYRRYTLLQAEDILRRAGLAPERGCYFYGAVLPLAAALRKTRQALGRDKAESQMSGVPPAANAVLSAVCLAESRVMTANRLAGLTAFVSAVRR